MDAKTRQANSDGAVRVTEWALILFVIACILPCIDCGPDSQTGDPGFWDPEAGWHFGIAILLFGWAGGNNGVPWSANLFLAAGLYALETERPRTAVAMGAAAVTLGLTTWWARHNNTLMIGYYCWQASLFLLLLGALWVVRGGSAEKRE